MSLSESAKKKISQSMKKAHAEGRAWNIGQSRWNNEPSYPEKFFMQIIENEFNDKDYIREYSVGIYSIDFAWPMKKLAIEIDGSQHYRFEEYRLRDVKKDKFLFKNGWKVIRINWKDFCNDTENYIRIAKDFIDKSEIVIEEQFIEVDYKLLEKLLKYKNNIPSRSMNNEQRLKYNNLKVNEIKDSNIDFSKIGWVNPVSEILNVTPQKVTQWMKKNMYDFWNKNCYKRKPPKNSL